MTAGEQYERFVHWDLRDLGVCTSQVPPLNGQSIQQATIRDLLDADRRRTTDCIALDFASGTATRDNTYGTCARRGQRIPFERLKILAAIKTCVNCASRRRSR